MLRGHGKFGSSGASPCSVDSSLTGITSRCSILVGLKESIVFILLLFVSQLFYSAIVTTIIVVLSAHDLSSELLCHVHARSLVFNDLVKLELGFFIVRHEPLFIWTDELALICLLFGRVVLAQLLIGHLIPLDCIAKRFQQLDN